MAVKKVPPLKLRGRVWYTYVWQNEKKRWISLYADYDKSLDKSLEIHRAHRDQKLGVKTVQVSFGHFKDEFMRLTGPGKKEGEVEIEKYIIGRFMNDTGIRAAEDFTPKLLLEWRADREKGHLRPGERRLSPASINRYMGLFKVMGKYAVKWRYVNGQVSDFEEIEKIFQPKKKRFSYTPDQVKGLYRVARKDEGFNETLFLDICFQTGMRESEIQHFQMSDVDFKQGIGRVQPKGKWTPKSYRPRWFPLTEYLKKRLSGLKIRPQDHVITYKGKQVKKGHLGGRFNWILKRSKLAGSIHIARHTWITEMMKRYPEPMVRAWAGHSSRGDVTENYTHIEPDPNLKAPVLPF